MVLHSRLALGTHAHSQLEALALQVRLSTMHQSQFVRALSEGRQQRIVCYGCSLTAGGAWVQQLQDALNLVYPDLATVTNSGAGAMWSRWGRENLDERVISKNPDAVFIEFSMNDAFLAYETSVAEARENLQTMIDRMLEHNREAEIIIMVMNPPTGEHLERRPRFEEYNQMYRDVAGANGLLLIDHQPNWEVVLAQGMSAFLAYVPDGLHPAPIGCQEVITPHILASLGIQI